MSAAVALVLVVLAVVWLPVQVWCEVNPTRLERVRVTAPRLAPGARLRVRHDQGMFDDWGGPKPWIDSGVGWTDKPVRLFDPRQVTLSDVVGE